eukprot:TRINITY_DN30949_c0_g1_i3.p2 TRINITY_DN30949_c0_g1~~TRINITY_DN30949_c0_g1_i3.p2  ORF type:complete len:262 (-),score=53.98 TRINITY_DN30949_c0_g1_i3:1449-2234(-)
MAMSRWRVLATAAVVGQVACQEACTEGRCEARHLSVSSESQQRAAKDELEVAAAIEAAASTDSQSPPDALRAGQFLNCEGLGDEFAFWPAFREALASEGPLGQKTLYHAYNKWSEWEDLIESFEKQGYFGGGDSGELRPFNLGNSTIALEGNIDRLDFIKVLQRASMQLLFNEPDAWTMKDLAGFLACPIGFVLVQYVIFAVQKLRGRLPAEQRMINWESMQNTFGLLLGTPSYALDHLESSDWGITSFDMAVNLDALDGG